MSPRPLHDHGGPLPPLTGGHHPELAFVIQEARGRLHEGKDPTEVGLYLAAQVAALPLGVDDLRCAIGYLLKAALAKGRMDLMLEHRKMRAEMGKAPYLVVFYESRGGRETDRQHTEDVAEVLRQHRGARAVVYSNSPGIYGAGAAYDFISADGGEGTWVSVVPRQAEDRFMVGAMKA